MLFLAPSGIFHFVPRSDLRMKYQGLCPGKGEWASWWEGVDGRFMEVIGEYYDIT